MEHDAVGVRAARLAVQYFLDCNGRFPLTTSAHADRPGRNVVCWGRKVVG
ncbi:uncharacterized protein SOCEGT47_077780 [Sorangium cellulosum]|uniref:Uncharacterized protein n=1 Tax=Sorangium cellulosum TaxID=56 RepID=A0A4P2QBV3_SORCE|nr:hypothetical protein [Sorangium cellulosum]AUX27197.1 uncharacterized protein SOCEGT47_077780 [Sorangium cellulosum]